MQQFNELKEMCPYVEAFCLTVVTYFCYENELEKKFSTLMKPSSLFDLYRNHMFENLHWLCEEILCFDWLSAFEPVNVNHIPRINLFINFRHVGMNSFFHFIMANHSIMYLSHYLENKLLTTCYEVIEINVLLK